MTIYNTVYQITNKINNKIYVGVHKTENLSDGYLGSGFALKRAVKKHGKENFSRQILSMHETYGDALVEEAVIVDEEFVKRKDTYNLKTGGGRGLFSEESRQNMSAAQKGKIFSAKTRAKISAANKNPSAETRAKISIGAKGRTHNQGRVHSVESRANNSAAQRGKTLSAKTRAKISAALMGNTHSKGHIHLAETRAKISAAARNCSAETRAKISAASKNRPKKECPHCERLFYPNTYSQWHGDNCKQKSA